MGERNFLLKDELIKSKTMSEKLCKFCGTESSDIIQVTDADGDKWPMCWECLDHPHNEKTCGCGSKDYYIYEDGLIGCNECYQIRSEDEFWHLPNETIKKSAIKSKEGMAKFKVNKTQCDIVAKLIRKEFDCIGTLEPILSYQKAELNNLIQTAKGVKIGRAIISRDMIEEMENDIQDL